MTRDTRLLIKPRGIGLEDDDPMPDCLRVLDHEELLHGARLWGGCRIGSVEYWYHPPSDCVVRADKWADCVEGVEDYAP